MCFTWSWAWVQPPSVSSSMTLSREGLLLLVDAKILCCAHNTRGYHCFSGANVSSYETRVGALVSVYYNSRLYSISAFSLTSQNALKACGSAASVTQERTVSVNRSGASRFQMCPIPGTLTPLALGMALFIS